jgi:hypothetical protein
LFTIRHVTEAEEAGEWLAQIGYGIEVEEVDGLYWASLTNIGDGRVIWPRYGRGESADAAVICARQRHVQEQSDEFPETF